MLIYRLLYFRRCIRSDQILSLFDMFCPVQKKVETILIFGEAQRNYHAAERIFNERFSDRPITRKYLSDLVENFQTTFCI